MEMSCYSLTSQRNPHSLAKRLFRCRSIKRGFTSLLLTANSEALAKLALTAFFLSSLSLSKLFLSRCTESRKLRCILLTSTKLNQTSLKSYLKKSVHCWSLKTMISSQSLQQVALTSWMSFSFELSLQCEHIIHYVPLFSRVNWRWSPLYIKYS